MLIDRFVGRKRSPLKAKPLHNPGQSLDWEIEDLLTDRIVLPFLFASLFSALAFMEWRRWFMGTPPQPAAPTLLAAVAWAIFVYWLLKFRKQIGDLKLGRDGERAVGQYLDGLRANGAQLFHDVPAEGFNVDHVVIAPEGVFVVETKTLSKPKKGKAEVWVRDGNVLINGRGMDRNPIEQVNAIASWVSSLLRESTGKQFKIQPVVLFPGWFVHRPSGNNANGAWVLNPKALPAFISAEPKLLLSADVSLASYHLSRYIRMNG